MLRTLYGISFCDEPNEVRLLLLARAAGFEAVEITLGEPSFDKRLKAAREVGLQEIFPRLSSDAVNSVWSGVAFDEYFTYFKESVARAAKEGFDAVKIAVTLGKNLPAVNQAALHRVRALAAYAEEAGVRLDWENGLCPEHFEIAVRITCRGFHGVAFRPSLYARATGSSAVPPFALSRLRAVTLDDVSVETDGYIPSDGETDFEPFAACLAKISFRGAFLARVSPSHEPYHSLSYEAFASRTYEGLSRLARLAHLKEGVF